MALLATVEDLLAEWSKVALTPDPRASLAEAGHVIAPLLFDQLARQAPRPFPPEQRTVLLKQLRADLQDRDAPSRVLFAVRPANPVAARALPAGEFDVVATVRLEIANELFANLYATRAWPHDHPPGTVPLPIEKLRSLSDDVPDLDNLGIGAMHLTAAPTAEVGPDGTLRLAQALRLDVDVVQDSFPQRRTITSLSGVFHYDARPRAQEADSGGIRVDLDVATLGVTEAFFTISSDSLIQPRDDAALAEFSAFLADVAVIAIRDLLSQRPLIITPDLRLPFGDTAPIRVFAARTGTAPTALGLGAIHIGICVGFSQDAVPPEVPDVVTLPSDPIGTSSANVVVSVHEATLQAAAAATIPELQRRINAKVPLWSVVVESISVNLEPPDTFKLVCEAHVEDYCGPGPFNFNNLDFSVTADVEASVFDGTIRLEGDPEVDFSNADIAICAISALTDVALLQFVDVLLVLVSSLVASWKINTSDALEERSFSLNGVFDPKMLVPFTELVPRAEIIQIGVTEDRMQLRGILNLHTSTEHIFVYVTVNEGTSPHTARAIEDAEVLVLDQDVPVVPGDDFTPPVFETPVILQTPTTTIRLDLSFEPARRDEVMGSTFTDRNGRARLVLSKNAGIGGTLVTRRMTRFKNIEKDPTIEIFRTPLVEKLPDAYMQVRTREGRRFDSRVSGAVGLLINLGADHIGSPASPINVIIPREDLTEPT